MFIGGGVGGIGRIGGGGRRGGSLSPLPVAGDLIAMSVINGAVAAESASPALQGIAVALRFKGMGRRIPFTAGAEVADQVFNASTLEITVTDPGFSGPNVPVTRTRTVRGTLPLKQPWPRSWANTPSSVPPRTYVADATSAGNAYYTVAGGTKGGAIPTAFASAPAGNVTDGSVTWVPVPSGAFTGFVEIPAGDDVDVLVMLDQPFHVGTQILGVSIGAGAYQAQGVASRAGSLMPAATTQASTLDYLPPSVTPMALPHALYQGSACAAVRTEWQIEDAAARFGFGQAVAGMRTRVVDMAGAPLSGWVDAATSELSTQFTTSGPAGVAVEVYATAHDCSAVAAGHTGIEVEIFPWIGPVSRTRDWGEGAPWQASQALPLHAIRRAGGQVYLYTTAGVTGTTAPSHTSGTAADGTAQAQWLGADPGVMIQTANCPAWWHFRNDPASLFITGHVHVNTTGANIGSPAVFNSYAESRAAFVAGNSYGSIGLALTALQAFHNTAQPGRTIHNDLAGGNVWLTGVHDGVGTSTQTMATGRVWCNAWADPAQSGVELRTHSAGSSKAIAGMMRWRAPNLLIGGLVTASPTIATNTVMTSNQDSSATDYGVLSTAMAFDGTTNRQEPGGTATGGEIATGFGAMHYRSVTFSGQVLIGNANSRQSAAAVFGCTADMSLLASNAPCQVGRRNVIGNRLRGSSASTGNSYFNTGRGLSARAYLPRDVKVVNNVATTVVGNSGTTMLSVTGTYTTSNSDIPTVAVVVVGTVIEANSRCAGFFADGNGPVSAGVICHSNSFVGERTNFGYNDPNQTLHRHFYFWHNIFAVANIVWDSTSHATGSVQRTSARCQNYWPVYMVGSLENWNLLGSTNGGDPGTPLGYSPLRWPGAWRQFTSANVSAQFVNDRSSMGTGGGTFNGNYRPASNVVAIATARTFRTRRFALDGAALGTTGAIGALEAA